MLFFCVCPEHLHFQAGEQHLGRDPAQVEELRHLAVDLAAEAAEADLLELQLVLPADSRAVEDEDVVEVLVRVSEREVGRA